MINNVIGDILTPTTDNNTIVCHQVNCLGVMGAGLAKQIANKFPILYTEYKDICNSTSQLLSKVFYYSTKYYIIANCFSQYDIGHERCYTNYDAMRNCFKHIHQNYPNYTIRIPFKMGCGIAGGDWNTVLNIIKSEFCNDSDKVEIWTLPNLINER